MQALKYECYLDSHLVRFLLRRAIGDIRIAHYLFWCVLYPQIILKNPVALHRAHILNNLVMLALILTFRFVHVKLIFDSLYS